MQRTPARRAAPPALALQTPVSAASPAVQQLAVATLKDRVGKLRELSPLWDMYRDGIDISSIQWSAH